MKYNLDKYVVIDCEADHNWGLDPWHPEYKLESMAFFSIEEQGQNVRKIFTTDKDTMINHLTFFMDNEFTIIVYNLSYEHPVILSQLGIDIGADGRVIDAMRLYQYSTARTGKERSLKLTSAFDEFTGVFNYKRKYLNYFIDKGIAKTEKQAHSRVGSLPEKELEEYNLLDCFVTEEVMWHCIGVLGVMGYNWEMDHEVYIGDVKRNTYSYLRGLKIDFDRAFKSLENIHLKEQRILEDIHTEYKDQIELFNNTYNFKGIKQKELKLTSTKQLAYFCIEILGITPKHFTKKAGNPSFEKGFLGQWGEFGLLLKDLNKLRAPKNELLKIISIARTTGRLHAQVKAGLTSTGRSKAGKEVT